MQKSGKSPPETAVDPAAMGKSFLTETRYARGASVYALPLRKSLLLGKDAVSVNGGADAIRSPGCLYPVADMTVAYDFVELAIGQLEEALRFDGAGYRSGEDIAMRRPRAARLRA